MKLIFYGTTFMENARFSSRIGAGKIISVKWERFLYRCSILSKWFTISIELAHYQLNLNVLVIQLKMKKQMEWGLIFLIESLKNKACKGKQCLGWIVTSFRIPFFALNQRSTFPLYFPYGEVEAIFLCNLLIIFLNKYV